MIQKFDANNTDTEIFKYSQFFLTKARQMVANYFYEFDANEVFKNVYLGSINSVYDIENLKKHNIKNVISVIADFEPPYPKDFNYLVINALDTVNTDLTNIFDITNTIINDSLNKDESILIHCYAGRSRSVAIVIAYIIDTFGMDYENALKSVKKSRSIAEPNEKFKEQLINYHSNKFRNFPNLKNINKDKNESR